MRSSEPALLSGKGCCRGVVVLTVCAGAGQQPGAWSGGRKPLHAPGCQRWASSRSPNSTACASLIRVKDTGRRQPDRVMWLPISSAMVDTGRNDLFYSHQTNDTPFDE